MSESAEWLEAHKGPYMKTVGYIWQCGDDCDCTQALVVSYYRNKTDHRFRVPIIDWSGEFYVGVNVFGEYRDSPADAELAEHRRQLRESDPEREAAIEWQQGVDYDLKIDTPRGS